MNNINLNQIEITLIRHALGLGSSKKTFRNYFCAGGENLVVWDGLVEKGLAVKKESELYCGPMFFVRKLGALIVLKEEESISKDEMKLFNQIEESIK